MSKLHRSGDRWLFECPGCGCAHFANDRWTFNGDQDKPTFRPSILVTFRQPITDKQAERITAGENLDLELPHTRCHSFVTDGQIRFLDDCTHELKGQTIDLPEWDGD